MKKTLNVIDLFAGAGGLSEGFHKAGCRIVSYVEMNKDACETLKTRHAYWKIKGSKYEHVYSDYLLGKSTKQQLYSFLDENIFINSELSDKTIDDVISKIKNNMVQQNIKKIDIFIGGPPCQAYSLVGRARDHNGMKGDPRKKLFNFYVRLLKEFNPDLYVFENVPGLLTSKGKNNRKVVDIMKEAFDKAGYIFDDTNRKILNASDYGVLQNRKRVIVIGWKKGSPNKYPNFEKITSKSTVKDIFEDLPVINDATAGNACEYICESNDYLNFSGIRNGLKVVTQHITRPVNEQDKEIYRRVITKWNEKKIRLAYDELPENLKTHKKTNIFTDRFKIVAKEEKCSQTVVAHISKDGHYYIHPDINQLRSISIREAARLQSFPDNYYFEGSRTSAFKQIGNAVPPLLSELIAKRVIRDLIS
jgi:DNA (cytosine-5)-methyltransferase 1